MSEQRGRGSTLGWAALLGAAAAGIGFLAGKIYEESQENERRNTAGEHRQSNARSEEKASGNNGFHHSSDCSKCSICLDKINSITLPCGHKFHRKCIQDLRQACMGSPLTCPNCRHPFE